MAVAALTAASKMSLSCWRRLRSAAGGGGGDQLLVAAAVAVALLATARPASGGPAAVLLERALPPFWVHTSISRASRRKKATKPFSVDKRALWVVYVP